MLLSNTLRSITPPFMVASFLLSLILCGCKLSELPHLFLFVEYRLYVLAVITPLVITCIHVYAHTHACIDNDCFI